VRAATAGGRGGAISIEQTEADAPAARPAERAALDPAEFLRAIRDFAAAELNGDIVRRDREALFERARWDACARMGILGLPISSA